MASAPNGQSPGDNGGQGGRRHIGPGVIWPIVVLVLALAAMGFNWNKASIAEIKIAQLDIKFNLVAALQEQKAGCGPNSPAAATLSQVSDYADKVAGVKLKGSRVLWVDGNPQDQTYEKNALSAMGIQFDIALTTDEALQKLKENRYDLIISNFKRADDPFAGDTLLDDVKKIPGAPPVIIYTASWSPAHEAEVKQRGALGETSQVLTLFQMVVDALEQRKTA